MNIQRIVQLLVPAALAGVLLAACQPTRNFTTYFNLFYNMERIMDEVEEELLFIREQKTPEPVYYIPYDDLDRRGARYYSHLERRTMTNDEMRANKIKLDSILIKGSKLMARNAKSDYLDDAIYYIAKTYFYEREWYQSQKKCEELIAGFPSSKWYPDAHLVLSMDMMHQGNIGGAQLMLSRTIDIAWARERKDVLIDAFRLNADIQLAEGNVAEALKPYQRALLLSSDAEDLARWQYEIGLIYFRQGDFPKALVAFDSVETEFSPDVLTEFQTGMQRAAALRAVGQYDKANEQLEDLGDNSNYEPWYGLVELEKQNLAAARTGGTVATDSTLNQVEVLSPGKGYALYATYERGIRAYKEGDYMQALENFSKVRSASAPFQRRAQRYASLLERYFEQTSRAKNLVQGMAPETYPDSLKGPVAELYYNAARVFAGLDRTDSLLHYYDLSYRWSAPGSPEGARVLYARAMMAREVDRTAEADSLMEILVADYPLTDYAAEARRKLGYTEFAKIDPAEDLYKSGLSHMKVGEDQQALAQFQKVINGYAKSEYAPMAYYAIGLLYEKKFDQRDSAFSYYGRLLDLYPKSEQAITVGKMIQAVNLQRMRQPGNGEVNPNTGLDQEWMKENPPVEELQPQPDRLVPLNGDTTKRQIPKNLPVPKPIPSGGSLGPRGTGTGADTARGGTQPGTGNAVPPGNTGTNPGTNTGTNPGGNTGTPTGTDSGATQPGGAGSDARKNRGGRANRGGGGGG